MLQHGCTVLTVMLSCVSCQFCGAVTGCPTALYIDHGENAATAQAGNALLRAYQWLLRIMSSALCAKQQQYFLRDHGEHT